MVARRSALVRWMAAALLPVVLVTAMGAGPGLAATSGWTIVLSPGTIAAATATPIKVAFANLGGPDGTTELGCVRISIPLTFTINAAAVTSRPPDSEWSAARGLGTVAISAPSGGDRLPPDGTTSVTAQITVLALTPGTYTWTANAYREGDCRDGFSQPISLKVVVELDVLPLPTLPPILPTAIPSILPTSLPTLLPTPRSTPTQTPTPTPTNATPTPGLAGTATPPPPATPIESPPPGAGGSSGTAATSDPSGPTSSPTASGRPTPSPPAVALALPGGPTGPSGDGPPPITLTSGFETPVGEGFEWAVPGLVLSVPGLLIVLLAVSLQLAGAAAWLPIVRRRIGGFGLGRRARRPETRAGAE